MARKTDFSDIDRNFPGDIFRKLYNSILIVQERGIHDRSFSKMKKLFLIAAMVTVGFMVLAYFASQIIRPVPFMTKAEGESLSTYKEVAHKLKSKTSVDKKRFPTRADFVANLLSTNFYTADQISFLADDECLSGNELYEDDIVFWRRGDKAVFYVSKYFDCYMTSQQDFDKRLESYSKP